MVAFWQTRRHPRIAVDIEVRVKLSGTELRVRAEQMGAGGMMLRTPKLEVAQPVELFFTLPSGPDIHVGGVVWWKKSDAVGVRFDFSEARQQIESYIQQRAETAKAYRRPI